MLEALYSDLFRRITDDFSNILAPPTRDESIDFFALPGDEDYDPHRASSRADAALDWLYLDVGPTVVVAKDDGWRSLVLARFQGRIAVDPAGAAGQV